MRILLSAGLCLAVATSAAAQATTPETPAEMAARDGGIPPFTAADVHFMSGMIPHHAQAVRIARWAPSHGARSDLQILAERIVVAQRDEIAFMQRWLGDRKQEVPDSNATHAQMEMGGARHAMLMPGMLTDAELIALDGARGTQFDRLFLTSMIRHHEGALTMVTELFAAPGAAQDDDVFKFVSDVEADQSTEIERMLGLLASLPPEAPHV